MEAATERINSASWREKYHRTCNSYPTNGRSECGTVGSGAEILHKSPRYYDTSPGDNAHQDGRPKEELRKWSSATFQQWLVHPAKDSCTLAEFLVLQTNQNVDSPLTKEIFLSQFKDEVFLSSASHSVCPHPQDKVQSISDNLPEYQGELSPISVKNERLSPANPCSIKSENSSQSATTSPGLTTELENFQDLTAWCHLAPKPMRMSVPLETDELNTPIIEFGDFMFESPPINNHSNDNYYGLLNVQNENENELVHSNHPDGLYINDASDIQINKHDNDNDNNISCQLSGQLNYNYSNSNNEEETSYQYFINDMGGGECIKKNTKTTLMNSSLNNIFTTKCADHIYSETINQQLPNNVFATLAQDPPVFELNEPTVNTEDIIILPFENAVSETTVVTNTKKNLQLDFSNLWTSSDKLTPTVMDTPEVINTALAMDKTFNLINFITNESNKDPPSIQSSETQLEDESRSTTTNDPDPDPSYTPSEASDDEDYEPPSKKNRNKSTPKFVKRKTTSKKLLETSDSDISNMSTTVDVTLNVVRRGRPPKRKVSISSESTCPDNEVSRYRELRDKNNEASRRSRLNRKMKEVYLEQEAEGLDVKNRKLKVQVQEMERQVNTLRQNLMQMLLKK